MKKIIIALSLLAATAGLNSCSEFLDQVPDNRTEIDNMDKVKALLVSAYPIRYPEFLEFRCDGIVDHGATLRGTQPGSNMDFIRANFRWDDYPTIESSTDQQQFWFACYSAIASANHAIDAIEKLGYPSGSESSLAEARLCRAYNHFMLLTLFADFFDETGRTTNPGIPFVDEPEELVNKPYDRGTVASVLEKIKEDLAYGLRYVSTDYVQPKFHFTLDAARMLAIRVALYERDYPTVINYASTLIDTPTKFITMGKNQLDNTDIVLPADDDAALISVGTNLFNWIDADYNNSDEYGINFQRATNSNIILASEPYSMLGRITATTFYTRYAYNESSFNSISGDNATGLSWDLPKFGSSSAPAGTPSFVPKFYEDFKVTNINANTGMPYCRVALFRREEAILARAEAYAMMGNYDQALWDLSMYVQNRVADNRRKASVRLYGLTRDKVVNYYAGALSLESNFLRNTFNTTRFTTGLDTTDGQLQRSLILTVLDFRRTEFMMEGYRWFDILRWSIPVTHRMNTGETSTLTPDDDRRLLQLPRTVDLSDVEYNSYDYIPNPWS